MARWLKAWYHRYHKDKNMLRGVEEISFNAILDIRAAIERQLKEDTREYYVFTLWEGVCMAKNGAKNGLTLVLQAKEGPGKLKYWANTETSNIKA